MVALRKTPDELAPPLADGLVTRKIGPHGRDKFVYWGKLSNSVGRATKQAWSGRRACVDLYASCGVNEDRQTGELSWGSALLALQAQDQFDAYVFGDCDPALTEALAARCAALDAEVFLLDRGSESIGADAARFKAAAPPGPKVGILLGDANEAPVIVKMMLPGFARQRLVLALVDPPGVSFAWDSLSSLTLHERIDVMLLFPKDMDIERNLAYPSRLDEYFGTAEWKQVAESPGNRGLALRRLYKERMERLLGLYPGDDKVVKNSRGVEIYKWLFGSREKLGLRIWNDVTRPTPWGQDALYFEGLD